MNPLRWKVATMFAGLLAALAVAGCGGKSKEGDVEPPPVAANTPAQVNPKVEPPKNEGNPPKPKDEPRESPGSGLPSVPPPFVLPRPPMPMAPQPTPKDPPSGFVPPPMPEKQPEKKDPDKPFEWPTSIYGRPLAEYIKDADDPDPAIREQALRTIPNFGPAGRTAATKVIIKRMNGVYEKDPGVRAAAFEAIGSFALLSQDGSLESEADTTEAIRLLIATIEAQGSAGSGTRLHAVNTLASFGQRAATAIPSLVSLNMTKPDFERAYETRRAVATTLGNISFIKDVGPSPRSLHCLTEVLIHDPSAAVRLAAYQSLVLLGPPYLPPGPPPAAGGKPVMKVDEKAIEVHAKAIKSRLAPYKAVPGTKEREPVTGLMERDRQVEIFARLALMRLDVKEINDENLNGIGKYVTQPGDSGPKLQALQALGLMNEFASRKINDVCKALEDEDPNVASSAVMTLVAMGKEAKPAIEFLEKLKKRGSKKGDKDAKDLPNEYYADLATRAIKAINEAKAPIPKP